MSELRGEIFLAVLLAELRSRHATWYTEDDHFKIIWTGYPRNTWPEADLMSERQEELAVAFSPSFSLFLNNLKDRCPLCYNLAASRS